MCEIKVKAGMIAVACMIIVGVLLSPTREVWKRDIVCAKWEITTIWQPSFSVESGYYEKPFMLEIKPKLGGEIYYTLDGSEPNCSKIRYEAPILIEDATKQPNVWSSYDTFSKNKYYIPEEPVAKAVVIRAVEYYGAGMLSEINTAVYFVGEEMKQYFTIPNLVFVTEPDNLFGYKKGIMVLGETYDDWIAGLEEKELETLPTREDYNVWANYRNKGEEWEREVNLQYFEDGQLVVKQDVGIRSRGKAGSRGPTKCFNIYAREEYDGNKKMLVSFDNGRRADSVSLRNHSTILHDGLVIGLLDDRAIAPFHYQPVNFWIDGEYWGLYNLTEKYNRQFFEDYYNVRKESVVLHKSDGFTAETGELEQRSSAEWDSLYEFVANHDLALQENYDVVCNMIDLDSFIDYYCAQIYIDSQDCKEDYNVMQWKSVDIDKKNPYMDGKWRWVLYDIDYSIVGPDKDNLNHEIREGIIAFGEHKLLKALLENVEFKQQFINTMMDMMNSNFKSDCVSLRLRVLANEVAGSKALHFKRFCGNDDYLGTFYEKVDAMDNFFRERPEYVVDMFQKKFDLNEPVTIEISSENAGDSYIRLNTIEIGQNDAVWQGDYFEDIPVKLSAMESDNRKFLKWVIMTNEEIMEITDPNLVIYPKLGMKIKALYQRK